MPVSPTYPGVYVEEIPSGVRPIAGVATSIAAFVDDFARGPQDAAVQVLGATDFERVYGGLHASSEASYALQQFFLNGGSQAWVVRVCEGTAATAAAVLGDKPNGTGTKLADVAAGREVRGSSYNDPGVWGNGLRLEVDYGTSDPTTSFNLTVSEVASQNGRAAVARSETFRNLVCTPKAATNFADVVNESSQLVQLVSVASPPSGARPPMTGTVSAKLAASPPTAATTLDIAVKVSSTETRSIAAVPVAFSAATLTWDQARATLEAALQAADPTNSASEYLSGATVELYTVAAGDQRLRVRLTRGPSLLTPAATVAFTGAGAAALSLSGAGVSVSPQLQSLAGGVDGAAPTAADLVGVRANRTGVFALEEADLFNILCIPQAAALSQNDMAAVVSKAAAYCQERRSFMIVDIPASVATLDQMQAWMSANDTLRDTNLATYFPRPQIPDPLSSNRLRSVAPSGTIAGLYARTDASRGVWKAPAGTDAALRGVQALDFLSTDLQDGVLNQIGVNVLRSFPVYGNLCWGARTLAGADAMASEWKYIPIRRTAFYIEESLFRGLKWVVFEPNDEPLWAQIRLNVGAFMHGLFRKGAFQGKSAREAYLVKCDSETTTQADIDLGVVNIVVGFAPLKPAEFVIIQIQQLAGNIEV